MEGLNAKSERFDELSAEEVDQIISQSASKRTQQCTNWGVSVFNDWLQTRYPEERLEYLDAETLAERLKRFYQEVKKSPTENYSASTHICIRSAIDRHLTDNSEACKISIIKGQPFIRANKSLKAKLKLLRTEGVGQINRAYSILAEDLQKCYETGVFGDHCPYSLLRVNWFNLTLHFPYRGRQSQRKILKDSFEIRRDNNGVEYVTMVASSSTVYSANDVENKMFSSGTERCPVRLFKKLLSVLNPRLDALFQAPAKNFKPEDAVWFQAIAIGVNRLSSMMREISKDAGLSRTYNNNCIRATTVTVLDYAGKLVQQINCKASMSKRPRLAPKITTPSTSMKPISSEASSSIAPTMVTPPITSNILLLKRVENEQPGVKTNNLVLLQPVNMEPLQTSTGSMTTFTLNSLTGPTHTIKLDGSSLTTQELVQLGKGATKVEISDEALFHVQEARDVIDDIVDEHKVVYGVTTGFGKFAQTVIEPGKLRELQENLIRSHAAGVGDPLSPSRTRMVMALRINVLAKGYSGISVETLKKIIAAFNASCLPWIPEQGTVGASGDLAPLSHLALGLMGEGKMWSPKSGWADAKQVLDAHDLTPISLGPKEGLAMINGTQLITALGVEALERCKAIARQADVIAALSLECLKGTTRAFDSRIHKVRPHKGQNIVAQRFRSLLNSTIYPSAISESHIMCNKVQDPYSLRCCPQVHGIVLDTIEFVQGILNTEMNSATDNPMVFAEFDETVSGGNFHGEYPAKALDYLAIGIHELSSISERRTNRLTNPAYSGLPAFLVEDGGFNSGFMVAHCTAASLVSENKVLCHPSSVDSLSTSAGTEDHVSMGGWSARKLLKVVENVERVLAIELLAACQGIEFLRPLTTTKPLEAVHSLVRTHIQPWDKDRYMKPDIDKATELLKEEKIWEAVEPFFTTYMCSSFETDLSGHQALLSAATSS